MEADPEAVIVTVMIDGEMAFRTDADGNTSAPTDYGRRKGVALALAGAAAALADLPAPDQHLDTLREASARLEAIGTPAARDVLLTLSESTERHADTVQNTIAFIDAMENPKANH